MCFKNFLILEGLIKNIDDEKLVKKFNFIVNSRLTDIDEILDKASVLDEFYKFAQKEQQKEVDELIIDENLNEDAAKRYITTSLKREYASDNGTELNAILPKMSPLNPQYLTKKQTVFQKIATLVEKFKGVGGKVWYGNNYHELYK